MFASGRSLSWPASRPILENATDDTLKIALAQFNPKIGDFEGNRARILELALPELCM
jgi:hypothetical protein